MTKKARKNLALVMAGALFVSAFTDPTSAAAARKKVKLNKSKLVMVTGEKTSLTLKNYTGKKKVKWSVNKKKIVKLTPKGKKKVKITAGKAGTVKITAKAGSKKYICKVTVKKSVTPSVTAPGNPTETPSVLPASGEGITATGAPDTQTAAPDGTGSTPQPAAGTQTAVVDVTQTNQSHALLQKVVSTSGKVQGVSVYSKSDVHLVQVFGDFTDIQEVYGSLTFQYASEGTEMKDVSYSPEAYFSDGTPGYYILNLEGTLDGTVVQQTYFLGRAGIFTYKEDADGAIVIKNYEGWGEHLVVPSQLDGKKVAACGKESFYHKTVGDVVLPEGITELRTRAFYKAGLSYMEFPESLETIETECFRGCSNLTSVSLPGHIRTMGRSAFDKTPWYQGLQPDENGLVISGTVLFNGYEAAGEIEIPEGITCIARWAFRSNRGMTKVTIPSTVTKLGEGSFAYCATLSAISVPDTLQEFEEDVFSDTPWENEQEDDSEYSMVILNHVVLRCDAYEEKYIEIPEKVVAIAPGAFREVDMERISLPQSLETIGEYAFYACDLKSIEIPDRVMTIAEGTFADCSSLSSVTLPSHLTGIAQNAFKNCSALQKITFPETVRTVGSTAFYRCDSLETVTIQGAKTTIADDAFYRCYNEKLTFYAQENSTVWDFIEAKGYTCFSLTE